jgi:hypothetical protein
VGFVGNHAVVHWPGLPDAYDQYIPRSQVIMTVDEEEANDVETMDMLSAPLVVSSDFEIARQKYAPMWVNPLDFTTTRSLKHPRVIYR